MALGVESGRSSAHSGGFPMVAVPGPPYPRIRRGPGEESQTDAGTTTWKEES